MYSPTQRQYCIDTLRPRQNELHFSDDISKWIFFNENLRISIEISLKFVPMGLINNIPALVQIMAWHGPGDKPLSEPMMISLLMHICVTRPQRVKKAPLPLCHAWSMTQLLSHWRLGNADVILNLQLSNSYRGKIFWAYPAKLTQVISTRRQWWLGNIGSGNGLVLSCNKLSTEPSLLRYGPLTRYVTLRVVHAPGMQGTFSPPPTLKETAS